MVPPTKAVPVSVERAIDTTYKTCDIEKSFDLLPLDSNLQGYNRLRTVQTPRTKAVEIAPRSEKLLVCLQL